MKKEITGRAFFMINGEYRNWDDLSDSVQQKIKDTTNDIALRAIGYSPVKNDTEDKTA